MASMPIEEKIRNGDISAFEKVFREFYAPLTLFATTFVKDKDVAEEIVQDFFYHYWKDRKQTQIQSSMKSYFFQSIRNRALKHLRHENVKLKYASQTMAEATPSLETYELNTYELKELESTINNILDKLPPVCSQIFRMNRFEGLKYREIAERLSISIKTVEANMSKALTAFRQELRPYRE